jgi:hypothetical protein
MSHILAPTNLLGSERSPVERCVDLLGWGCVGYISHVFVHNAIGVGSGNPAQTTIQPAGARSCNFGSLVLQN